MVRAEYFPWPGIHMGWCGSACVAVVLLVFAAVEATAGETKRVLLLQSFGSDVK